MHQPLTVVEAPALDCRPDLHAPAPYGSSCGWWVYMRKAPRHSFGLSPAGPRGERPGHQALAVEHPPQAWPSNSSLFSFLKSQSPFKIKSSGIITIVKNVLLFFRTPWKRCCFSGDGEYIVAGSARQHALYIWEKSIGNLVKILHGTRGELLLDVAWHPVRPIIASISSGVVSIWAQNQVENWSAFAPDFKELDENVEYEERESEFDIEDEDKSEPEQTGGDAAEDEEVDVTSVDPIVAFCSSDEELEDSRALLYLPIAPEVEDPEENPYGPPPDAQAQTAPDDAPGDKKQKQSSTDPPAKKKARTTTIELQGVPNDEVHPLLGVKGDSKSKKKTAGRPKGSKGKDREFVRSKAFRDRAVFPLEPVGGTAGAHISAGLKGRAEGLAPGKKHRDR
uniref:Uncharacterized protein n=1 Tax=Periophthalmus magnuspinnatus TaxID=409849 RepID=A0A3B4B4E5_9GOBI